MDQIVDCVEEAIANRMELKQDLPAPRRLNVLGKRLRVEVIELKH